MNLIEEITKILELILIVGAIRCFSKNNYCCGYRSRHLWDC